MLIGRGVGPRWGIAVLLIAGVGCETASNPTRFTGDVTPPTLSIVPTKDTEPIASGLQFTVTSTDDITVKDIRLTYSGGYVATTDTVFSGTTPSVTFPVTVTFPPNSGAGGRIRIVGRATDGAGNFKEDTVFILLLNIQSLSVVLTAPTNGAVASSGKSVPVQVIAVQKTGIRKIGFQVSPPTAVTNPTVPPNDSISYSTPYVDSVTYTDTLNVLATSGTFTITGFAEDSTGRRVSSNTVTVTVQSAANDTTPPAVSDSIGPRVQVSDSVFVHATDPSAITWIGFRVRNLAGGLIRFDTTYVGAGNLTDVRRGFPLNLAALSPLPQQVQVDGYACDGAARRNCGFSTVSAIPFGAPKIDTVTVVAGVTIALPAGGTIADAIFDANRNELYLTNPTLSRVEIFQVANTTFVAAGIPTGGPQPWGIALWPRDTLGAYGDTIVVANSGGTELSVIDVTAPVRRLRWRQDLPDFLIQTYKVITVAGGFKTQITEYNISDRPQYLGTVCRPNSGATACNTDSIFAVYSTTPEPSNPTPFTGRATIRMEKLKNTLDPTQLFGHFFWEIAAQGTSATSDTLRMVLRRGLPYNQTIVTLSACAGVNVELANFALGDTTFVRNSGNFTHGFFGEGGTIASSFGRVMLYTTKQALLQGAGTIRACNTAPGGAVRDSGQNDVDLGMSPGVDVTDFISNAATKVRSIAINFNGGTNLVRADSIYYLDEGLRLKGTSVELTGAFGMDMNYNHAFAAGQPGTPTFGGTGNPSDRLAFAARPDGTIDVFDTFFYGLVASIPVRDPIIGPLRVAKDALGQLLFGITARGLVMVRLPSIVNPNPVRMPNFTNPNLVPRR